VQAIAAVSGPCRLGDRFGWQNAPKALLRQPRLVRGREHPTATRLIELAEQVPAPSRAPIGTLTVIPVAVLTGRLAGRFGHRPFLIGGALLYAAAALWFMLVPGDQPSYLLQWLPGLLLSGTSVGLVLPSLSAAAVSRLPAQHYAVGSAVNQATRGIGSVIGVAPRRA
jgi:hypothetical protein